MKSWLCFFFPLVVIACTKNVKQVKNEASNESTISQDSTGGKFGRIFRNADSVLIISHFETAGIEIYDPETGKSHEPEQLVVNQKLNRHIIQEIVSLNTDQKNKLAVILARSNKDRIIQSSRCFFPHHSIVVFSGNDISSASMCFGCRRISGMGLSEVDFDTRKWKEVLHFYQECGITYELDGVVFE